MKSIIQIATGFMFSILLFISAQSANAQSQWTYSMSSNGVTYKIHFQQERGTLTVQLYDSNSNKWSWATILESKPSPTTTSEVPGYYKVRAGNGYVYKMWTYYASGSMIVQIEGQSGQWTYTLETVK